MIGNAKNAMGLAEKREGRKEEEEEEEGIDQSISRSSERATAPITRANYALVYVLDPARACSTSILFFLFFTYPGSIIEILD